VNNNILKLTQRDSISTTFKKSPYSNCEGFLHFHLKVSVPANQKDVWQPANVISYILKKRFFSSLRKNGLDLTKNTAESGHFNVNGKISIN
jgi:hypothetical protein